MERNVDSRYGNENINSTDRFTPRVSVQMKTITIVLQFFFSICCIFFYSLTNKRKLEYRRVKVRGTFDHSKEMYLSPRSCIENNAFVKDENGFLSPFGKGDNKIGAVVVTPFKLADRE